MPIRFASRALLLCVVALGACGPSASPLPAHVASVSGAGAGTGTSLDAENALLRLLLLIRDRPELRDVDREALQEAFGVPFVSGDDAVDAEDGLRYEGRVGEGWRVAIVLSRPGTEEAVLELAFAPESRDAPGPPPPATAICNLDFNRFATEMRDMGLLHDALRGDLGRSMKDMFRRPGQRVTVLSRGEADDTPEHLAHACVRRVLVE